MAFTVVIAPLTATDPVVEPAAVAVTLSKAVVWPKAPLNVIPPLRVLTTSAKSPFMVPRAKAPRELMVKFASGPVVPV